MNKISFPYIYSLWYEYTTKYLHATVIERKLIHKAQFMLTTYKITNLTLTFLVKRSKTKEMKQTRCVTYLKVVLPILFIGYLACIISFTHVHIVNGVTIVHSHPYNKQTNPPSDHQHTGQQLQLYQQFSSIQAEGDIYCSIQLTPTYVNETILLFPSVNNMFILSPTDAFNLRAPPSNL